MAGRNPYARVAGGGGGGGGGDLTGFFYMMMVVVVTAMLSCFWGLGVGWADNRGYYVSPLRTLFKLAGAFLLRRGCW